MNTLKKSEDPGHLAITSSPSLKIILTTGTGAAAYTQIQELQYRTYIALGLRMRIRIIFERWIWIRIRGNSWIRIRIKVITGSFKGSKQSLEGRGRSQRRPLKMEPWKISRPVVAESHHFDEE